jgi:hypothetical protein
MVDEQGVVLVAEAQELETVLWRALVSRLSDEDKTLFALYQLLFLYEKLTSGRMVVGELLTADELRANMTKTLDQARMEVSRLRLESSVSSQ